jgi:CheY-like chemotaxis protein
MPSRHSTQQILVCEDDPDTASFFVEVLELAGYRTICAADGEAGLRLAAKHRPAAILLDLAMPGLEGGLVLTRLKADPSTAEIPVVIVSAFPGWLTFLDRQKAVAVVEKPCLPAELESAVAQALAVGKPRRTKSR